MTRKVLSPPPAEKLNFPKDSFRSWVACFCAFQSQVLIIGTLHGFGVFFIEFTKEFNTTRGNAAWISSAAYGLSMFAGPLASTLNNKFQQRYVMIVGCALCTIAVLSSSFVTSFPLLFLTFSFVFGLGASLAITCTVTVSQEYFDKNVTIAMGIISAGSSIGTLVMAPMSRFLIDSVGWRNSFRIMSGTCGLCMLCNYLLTPIQLRHKISVHQVRTSPLRKLMEDLKLWKNRVFIVWTCAITCVMFGYYIPYVHLVSYAIDCGISPAKASLLIMIFGASTAFGRILFGKIVQIGLLDRIRMHQLSMVITGAGTMFLPAITSFSGIAGYIVVVGLVDGCYVVLLPLLTCSLVGTEHMVLAWGFLIGACSITFTLGPPIAGFIYDATGSYNLAFHFAGIPILSGAVIMFLIPWAQRTSKTNNVLKELEVPQADELEELEIVDFITLSRVPSMISSAIISSAIDSKVTLVGSRRDNESASIAPESLSLLDADWGAYFVNNLNQMTIVPGNTALRAGMREVDFDLSALERTDEVLSEMLKGGGSPVSQPIRLSGPALIVSSSPRCQSCRTSYRRSDVINISPSCARHIAARRVNKGDLDEPDGSVSNVAVQTDLTFSNHSTSPQFPSSFRRSNPSPIPLVSQTDRSLQRAYATASGYTDVTPATTPSEGFISGYKGKLKETPKGSTRVMDPVSKNRTAVSVTTHHLQNRTIDEDDSSITVPLPFQTTAEPLFGPDVNLRVQAERSPHSPQFYTSHNRKDYGTAQLADDTNGETLPVDIPTPDHDTSAKGSEFDMFHMELPPSPRESEERILKLSRSPSPVQNVLPNTDNDRDDRSPPTVDESGNRLSFIIDDSGKRVPFVADNSGSKSFEADNGIKMSVPANDTANVLPFTSDAIDNRLSFKSDGGNTLPLPAPNLVNVLSFTSHDSDKTLPFTVNDSDRTLTLSDDDSVNRLPFDTCVMSPQSSPVLEPSHHRQGTEPDNVLDVKKTHDAPENNLIPNESSPTNVKPSFPSSPRNKWEDFSEHPVRTNSSVITIQSGAIFHMDPLSPPVATTMPSIQPSPTAPQNVTSTQNMETLSRSNHNTAPISSNEQTNSGVLPQGSHSPVIQGQGYTQQTASPGSTSQRSISPVTQSQESNQQMASSGSISHGSHSNLMFKMDPVVRDSKSFEADSGVKMSVPANDTGNVSPFTSDAIDNRLSFESDGGNTLPAPNLVNVLSFTSHDSDKTLPFTVNDSDKTLPFTVNDSDRMLTLSDDDSVNRLPFDTGVMSPRSSPVLELSPHHSQGTEPDIVPDVKKTHHAPENNLITNESSPTNVKPSFTSSPRNKWEDFSEHPVRKDSSVITIQSGAIFHMDPLSPPVATTMPSSQPSPTAPQNVTSTQNMETFSRSDHDNTVSISSNEQTNSGVLPQGSLSPVIQGQRSTQQTASPGSMSQRSISPAIQSQESNQQTASPGSMSHGSHSNLMFKMDPVVRDSQSDTSQSSPRHDEHDDKK